MRSSLRPIFAFIPCLLLVTTAHAQPDQIQLAPRLSVNGSRNDARWADWEAQARITDGDYDGAVQAAQQADAERHEADRREMLARSSRH